MADSVADRIVLDDEVLARQERTLGQVATAVGSGVSSAQTSIGQTAFGAINGFLAGAITSWAGKTAETVRTAGELAERMQQGVATTRTTFAEVEETLASAFDDAEDEG